MKTIKRLIIATLSLVITVGSLAIFGACGKKKQVVDDECTIQVQILDGGYGKEWFNKCCDAFKQKHPEVNFDVVWDIPYGDAETILKAGPNVTKTDLFFGSEPVIKFALYGDNFLNGYDCIFEDLSDIYNSEIEGENITVKDKMIDGFVDAYSITTENADATTTTKYYCFPWVTGVMGLVYNATQFQQMGLRVPRTTDELFDVTCKTIKDNGKVPFVASKDNTYDYSLWDVWQTQYYSIEGMDLYWQCKVKDEGGSFVYSENARKGIGELRYLSAIEKMLSPDYGNMHPNVNTLTFTQAQAQMLLGNAMMYYCGDWLENEMKNSKGNGDDLKYMKTPILSGIIDKTPTINDDLTLRAVISYIDGESGTVPSSVSEEDIAYIRQAREVEFIASFQSAYIPVYAKAKVIAKEFLKFLATDEAIKICLDETGGSSLPMKLNRSQGYNLKNDSARWNTYSEFIKSKYDMLDSVKQSPLNKETYRLNLFGALKVNSNKYSLSYEGFSSNNAKDRITAQQIYDDRQTFFTYEKLMTALERAGMI